MKQQNSSFGEQMKNIADKVPRAKMFQLPSLMTIGYDGLDHINIWESGETNLGKALSSFTALPFEHSEHGYFVSIEGFWHYIRSVSKDENLRLLSGHNARTYGRTLQCKDVKDVYFVMADANWQKIKSYPALIKEINDLHMPFDSYYLEDNKDRPKLERVRARSLHAKWLVPAFHEMHEAIHQNREPDFTFLLDKNRNIPAAVSHPLISRENSHGGFNANLFYVYNNKPKQSKPKQQIATSIPPQQGKQKKSKERLNADPVSMKHYNNDSVISKRVVEDAAGVVESPRVIDLTEAELNFCNATSTPSAQQTDTPTISSQEAGSVSLPDPQVTAFPGAYSVST